MRLKKRLPVYFALIIMLGVFQFYLKPKWAAERAAKIEANKANKANAVKERGKDEGTQRSGLGTLDTPPPLFVPMVAEGALDTLHPELRAAAQEARNTISEFQRLRAANNPDAKYSIKVLLREGAVTEMFWVEDLTLVDGRFQGKTDAMPRRLRSIGARHPITVAPHEIIDWLVVQDEQMSGGYTVKLYRDHMNEAERAAFDKNLKIKIEPAE